MKVRKLLKWVAVESRLFTSAAYRREKHELYLRFQDGNIYRYFDCPQQCYNDFLAAESKGRYFARNIRNQFRYEQVYRAWPAQHPEILKQSGVSG